MLKVKNFHNAKLKKLKIYESKKLTKLEKWLQSCENVFVLEEFHFNTRKIT